MPPPGASGGIVGGGGALSSAEAPRWRRFPPKCRASAVDTSAPAASSYHVPTPEEVEGAVESLYGDSLQPFGRIVLRRIRERYAERQGGASADADDAPLVRVEKLLEICKSCESLIVREVNESEVTIWVVGRPAIFVDVGNSVDPYPVEMWDAAEAYFSTLRGKDLVLPGGRYACAHSLVGRDLPWLKGRSLGEACHIVHLAVSQRKLLGYISGSMVPYFHCAESQKKRCADHQTPFCGPPGTNFTPRAPRLAVASWEEIQDGLAHILAFAHGGSVTLSSVKRLFRLRLGLRLSETALGYARFADLLEDERLREVCSVGPRSDGQLVIKLRRGARKGRVLLGEACRSAAEALHDGSALVGMCPLGGGYPPEPYPPGPYFPPPPFAEWEACGWPAPWAAPWPVPWAPPPADPAFLQLAADLAAEQRPARRGGPRKTIELAAELPPPTCELPTRIELAAELEPPAGDCEDVSEDVAIVKPTPVGPPPGLEENSAETGERQWASQTTAAPPWSGCVAFGNDAAAVTSESVVRADCPIPGPDEASVIRKRARNLAVLHGGLCNADPGKARSNELGAGNADPEIAHVVRGRMDTPWDCSVASDGKPLALPDGYNNASTTADSEDLADANQRSVASSMRLSSGFSSMTLPWSPLPASEALARSVACVVGAAERASARVCDKAAAAACVGGDEPGTPPTSVDTVLASAVSVAGDAGVLVVERL